MNNYQDLGDAELLRLLRENNLKAFEAIYSRYWDCLYKPVYYFLKDEEAATEILQELFIWLWQHKETLTEVENLKAYLSAAAKYKAANYIRAKKIRSRHLFNYSNTYRPENLNTVENEMEFKELKAMVLRAVTRLPAKCREIYSLKDNGYSAREISEQLNISVKTVEAQLTIASNRIRASVKSYELLLLLVAVLLTL